MKLPGGTAKGWRKWALRGVIAAAVVAAYVAFTQLVDLEKVLEDVSQALGAWTYLLVGVFAFAETGAFVGLLVPGETVMILGGATAGQGATNVYIMIAIAWACAFAGDSTSFFIGRRLGREFLMRNGPALRGRRGAPRTDRRPLRPSRRQDDLHRPLRRLRPRLCPVHRRQLGDALPDVRPLQRPRDRDLGQQRDRPRISLLAQHRLGPQLRGQRRVRPRRLHRPHRRIRHPPPLSPWSSENRRAAVRWMESHRGDRLDRRPRPALPVPSSSSSGLA